MNIEVKMPKAKTINSKNLFLLISSAHKPKPKIEYPKANLAIKEKPIKIPDKYNNKYLYNFIFLIKLP